MEGSSDRASDNLFSFFSSRLFSCILIGMYTLSVTLYNPAMYHNTRSKIDDRVFGPRFTLGGCAGTLHQLERSIFAHALGCFGQG